MGGVHQCQCIILSEWNCSGLFYRKDGTFEALETGRKIHFCLIHSPSNADTGVRNNYVVGIVQDHSRLKCKQANDVAFHHAIQRLLLIILFSQFRYLSITTNNYILLPLISPLYSSLSIIIHVHAMLLLNLL